MSTDHGPKLDLEKPKASCSSYTAQFVWTPETNVEKKKTMASPVTVVDLFHSVTEIASLLRQTLRDDLTYQRNTVARATETIVKFRALALPRKNIPGVNTGFLLCWERMDNTPLPDMGRAFYVRLHDVPFSAPDGLDDDESISDDRPDIIAFRVPVPDFLKPIV